MTEVTPIVGYAVGNDSLSINYSNSKEWGQGTIVMMDVPTYRKWYEFWKPKIIGRVFKRFTVVSGSNSTLSIPDPKYSFPHTDR